MTDIEDRLRDAFGALDRAVTVPPELVTVPRRRRTGRVLLAAAAVVAVLASVSLWAVVDTEPDDVGVAAQNLAPAEFDQRVAPVCATFRTSRPVLRFATVDAYTVVAGKTLELVSSTRASLLALPAPTDDPELVADVLDDLAAAERGAGDVVDVATDRPDSLPELWQRVNTYLDLALAKLAAHGAEACGS